MCLLYCLKQWQKVGKNTLKENTKPKPRVCASLWSYCIARGEANPPHVENVMLVSSSAWMAEAQSIRNLNIFHFLLLNAAARASPVPSKQLKFYVKNPLFLKKILAPVQPDLLSSDPKRPKINSKALDCTCPEGGFTEGFSREYSKDSSPPRAVFLKYFGVDPELFWLRENPFLTSSKNSWCWAGLARSAGREHFTLSGNQPAKATFLQLKNGKNELKLVLLSSRMCKRRLCRWKMTEGLEKTLLAAHCRLHLFQNSASKF